MSRSNGNNKESPEGPVTITTLSVGGFKSILDEHTIEVRPLTLLAGANSSGKSSMMQPLLLLKQPLEAQYDPGPLLLDGPNAKFTLVGQFWPLHRAPPTRHSSWSPSERPAIGALVSRFGGEGSNEDWKSLIPVINWVRPSSSFPQQHQSAILSS